MGTATQIDLYDADQYVMGPPHAAFARLRRREPVYWQERSTGPGAHHEDVGLENEMVCPPDHAGGFEIGTKLVVRNDAASEVGDVRVGLGRHIE